MIRKYFEIIKNKFLTKSRTNISKDLEKKEMGWIATIIYASIFAVIFRSFFFEPFHIPSGSMKPNLLIGDYVFVSKLSYGYSKYSFPFGHKLNYFKGRIFFNKPKRGDVAVFRLPGDESINYIKRIIGLPGDEIQMKKGILYINKKPIKKQFEGFFTESDEADSPFSIMKYSEYLNKDKKILILDQIIDAPQDNTITYIVPQNHYFFMGDNRDNSRDSRYYDVGFVPYENLVGKAQIIFFSNPFPAWKFIDWISSIKFSRIFNKIN